MKLIYFVLNVVYGFLFLILDFRLQRTIKFLTIVFVVITDIYFIAPYCRDFIGACIHLVLWSMPFVYLSKIGKGVC